MAAWRFGRGWSEAELEKHLSRLPGLRKSHEDSQGARSGSSPWRTHHSRSLLLELAPGPPREGGAFERARTALETFAFSDPRIVQGHFDPQAPLHGRVMLLELKVPLLRFLSGVIVSEVREESTEHTSRFGFRYDTLEGHIEAGSEWFLVEKQHESGMLTLRIDATWRPGDFPNWWSRLGFALLGPRYQYLWHHRAHRRMGAFARGWPLTVPLTGRHLAHQGPEIEFTRGVPEWLEEPDARSNP